jgi:hypothetical protein
MGVLEGIRGWWKRRKFQRTGQAISEALTKACERAERFDLKREQPVIIFSDHHKGARDGADDFQRCERTYNAALSYYRAVDYHLMELGDVEELWENTFREVASSYPKTLALAAEFQRAGRYSRFFGNHDLAWKNAADFQQRMSAVDMAYAGVTPLEALRVVVDDGDTRGEIFILHGHQGTADSDKHAWLSQFAVHYGWRRAQILLAHPWNTPSMDWALRGQHARHMSTWAAEHNRVLIAGHTHLPVFYGSAATPTPPAASGAALTADGDPRAGEALQAAHRAWAEADITRLEHQKPFELDTPCYFNTGCCSFGDGDITGIELADNEIRLVRWPCVPDTAPKALAHMTLREVFEKARVAPPPPLEPARPLSAAGAG